MPMEFEMDISGVLDWAEDLAAWHGVARAQRIVDCDRPHYAGITCICGWIDDPPMPTPTTVEVVR
jgi:hypothetical protein